MEEQKTETLEEQKMRLKAEEMVKSADPKDQLVGSLYLNVQNALSRLWTREQLNDMIDSRHTELCGQCVFKRAMDPDGKRSVMRGVLAWVSSQAGTLFIIIIILLVYTAAKDKISLGTELKALPGVSRVEK